MMRKPRSESGASIRQGRQSWWILAARADGGAGSILREHGETAELKKFTLGYSTGSTRTSLNSRRTLESLQLVSGGGLCAVRGLEQIGRQLAPEAALLGALHYGCSHCPLEEWGFSSKRKEIQNSAGAAMSHRPLKRSVKNPIHGPADSRLRAKMIDGYMDNCP